MPINIVKTHYPASKQIKITPREYKYLALAINIL